MSKPKAVPPPVERQHKPRSGRRAYYCDHRTKGERDCHYRRFMRAGEPIPTCSAPEHGRMKREPNRPYMGQAIPDADA